jgi:ATP-dependent RNA helicase DDX5/DBP2
VPAVQSRNPNDVERWYQDNEVTVKEGDNVPNPVITFDESTFPGLCWINFDLRVFCVNTKRIPESVQTQLCKNYEKPTVIQSITWPVALSGKDVISIAKVAYLLGKKILITITIMPYIVSFRPVPARLWVSFCPELFT